MRVALLAFLFTLPLCATRHWVGSGTPAEYDAHYSYTDAGLQSAIDAAVYGDTITIEEGEINPVNVTLPYKTGNGWITIKCETLPPLGAGYRVNPTTNLPLCKWTAESGTPVVSTNEEVTSVTVVPATDRISWVDNPPALTGITEGTPIVLIANNDSGVGGRFGLYVCAALNDPHTDCNATRVDFLVQRPGVMNIPNGTPVYFYGDPRSPITGLAYNRYYYVTNSALGKVQLAETPGGAAIDITAAPQLAAATIARMPYPLEPNVIYYARNPGANDTQLSATPGGAVIDITTTGTGILAGRIDRSTRGWKFQGLDVSKASGGSRPYWLVGLGSGPVHPGHVARDFILDRMYIHGIPWEDGPRRSLFLNANNVLVKDSYLSENHDFASQSNAILISGSQGNIHVDNSYLSGQGESAFLLPAVNMHKQVPTNITFRRNWFDRPLEWYEGVYLARTNATTLAARTFSNNTACNTASSLMPGMQCTAYRPGNATACVITQASTVTIGDGQTPTGAWGFGVTNSCGTDTGFEFRYVGDADDYVCTGGITCVPQGALDWTGIVNRIRSGSTVSGQVCSGTNAPVAGCTGIMRYRFDQRNNFETKSGHQVLLEGNVFSGSWYSSSFDCHVVLNIQPGSAVGYSTSWWARASDHVVRNNLLRTGTCSFAADGTSAGSGIFETTGFRGGIGNVFRNNLSYDIGSYNWGKSATHVSSNRPIYPASQDGLALDHNTFDGVGFYLGNFLADSTALRVTNNIWVPNSASTVFPNLITDSGSSWNAYANTLGKCSSPCLWSTNAILNMTGSTISGTNYPNSFLLNITTGDFATRVGNLNFANHSGRNFRITSGPYAAGGINGALDGRQLGADQDEIEAFTGTLGADVEAGIPAFERRANLVITPSTTSAAVRFTPETSATCTASVWSTPAYSGAATTTGDSSGADRQTITLTGLTTATNYYGKLICGTGGADGIAILRFHTR